LDYQTARFGKGSSTRSKPQANFEETYDLDAPPSVVQERLRAAIDGVPTGSSLVPGGFHGRRFVGHIRAGGFEIWVRGPSYNSLAPRAFGRIEPTSTGTRVVVRIHVPRITNVVLALLLAFAGVGCIPVLTSVGYPAPIAALIGFVLLGLSLLVLRIRGRDPGFPRSESNDLRQFLHDLLTLPT